MNPLVSRYSRGTNGDQRSWLHGDFVIVALDHMACGMRCGMPLACRRAESTNAILPPLDLHHSIQPHPPIRDIPAVDL